MLEILWERILRLVYFLGKFIRDRLVSAIKIRFPAVIMSEIQYGNVCNLYPENPR